MFSKVRLKAWFSLLRMATFKKLAGKIELRSISPQELSKTFWTLIFIPTRCETKLPTGTRNSET